jgi:hypothetical protein
MAAATAWLIILRIERAAGLTRLSANSIELRIIEQHKFKLVKSATFARSRESL